MTKVFNFEKIITNRAIRTAKFHTVAGEWLLTIIALAVLKIALSGVSMFAGFNYLHMVTSQVVNHDWISIANAIIFLLLLEVLTWNFLSKFWKFSIRRQKGTAVGVGVFVIILFGISFYTSTNGIASYSSKRVDNTDEIKATYKARKESAVADYNQSIQSLQKQIRTIQQNPAGWVGGSRQVLTSGQQDQIAKANESIMNLKEQRNEAMNKIEAQKKRAIQNNQAEQTSEASKYFTIVAVLLAIMFLAHGGLMFFYVKIYKEVEQQAADLEEAKETAHDIAQQVRELSRQQIASQQSNYLNAVKQAMQQENSTLYLEPKETEAPAELLPVAIDQEARQEAAGENQNRGTFIGFRTGREPNRITDRDANSNDLHYNYNTKRHAKVPIKLNGFLNAYQVDEAHYQYLSKHRKITEQLLQRKNHPDSKPSLSKIASQSRKSIGTVNNVKRVLDAVITSKEGDDA